MTDDIKYPGTITLDELRRDNPAAEDETPEARDQRVIKEKAEVITRSQAKDLVQYSMACDRASTRGVKLLILADDSADATKEITITREQARDAQTWRAFDEMARRSGKRLRVIG